VFDPFMGSGTTIGEAHKLGCISLGRDINPVACESVRIALGNLDRPELIRNFEHLSNTVGKRIRNLYKTSDKEGEVLYYFWVKEVACVQCSHSIDLFPSRVIARDAYPKKKPQVQVCCPKCGDIFEAHGEHNNVICNSCKCTFLLTDSFINGSKISCSKCNQEFPLLEAIKKYGKAPNHRLYAKLVLTEAGDKKYLPTTKFDLEAYQACAKLLKSEVKNKKIKLPTLALQDGFNTKQALNYSYREWKDFFNDRQLLALGWLQSAIEDIKTPEVRDCFLILFSGLLEFNNMFASYKGEGTGAVRHMFAHHILKPEKIPIEANVWGTSKSSGSFCNVFKNRLLRAIDYRQSPFEVGIDGKVFNASKPFNNAIEQTWPIDKPYKSEAIYLSCGSSDNTKLPSKSIDLVITDPPFFDNVNYSELADFFYAWQQLSKRGFLNGVVTTRNIKEVQDADPDAFSKKLMDVFKESERVLKDNGLLVFSYHHSKPAGWTSLAGAVFNAGFSIINAHPVKAEMSGAAPKSQAKSPIQLDILLVCTKAKNDVRAKKTVEHVFFDSCNRAYEKVKRLCNAGFKLSVNDCRIIYISSFLSQLPTGYGGKAIDALTEYEDQLSNEAEKSSEMFLEIQENGRNGLIRPKQQVQDILLNR